MFIQLMLTFHTGEILTTRTNCPGSWHNSHVAEGIYEKLENETPDGFHLVANLAFPQGHDRVVGKILVPLKAGQQLLVDPHQQTHMLRLS